MGKLIETAHESWHPIIEKHLKTDKVRYCLDLSKTTTVAPEMGRIFKAYTIPKKDVRIVILALSPYFTLFQHNKRTWRHATGIAMGVPPFCTTLPPTLSELEWAVAWEWADDYLAYEIDRTLKSWHDQGIMLLNCSLTSVIHSDARIHLEYWRDLICDTLEELSHVQLFGLMGSEAHKFEKHCNPFATIFKLPHPVRYKRTDKEEDRLMGKGFFIHIKENFPNLIL
jgi:uracil DNA glycosylase